MGGCCGSCFEVEEKTPPKPTPLKMIPSSSSAPAGAKMTQKLNRNKSSSSQLSKLKLEQGPQLKFRIDEKCIQAVLQEKLLLRNDAAKIGTGGYAAGSTNERPSSQPAKNAKPNLLHQKARSHSRSHSGHQSVSAGKSSRPESNQSTRVEALAKTKLVSSTQKINLKKETNGEKQK